MKRYDAWSEPDPQCGFGGARCELYERTLGQYVTFDDHEREVSALRAELARTLAAEVDARDEVITKLLDLTAPHVDDFGNRQWWQYKRPEQMHARACEIAGRME